MPTKDEAMDQHIADDLRVLIGSLSALGFAPRKYDDKTVFGQAVLEWVKGKA
jgi:hypothetical protein